MGLFNKLKKAAGKEVADQLLKKMEEATKTDLDGDGKIGSTAAAAPETTAAPAAAPTAEAAPAASTPPAEGKGLMKDSYIYKGPLTERFDKVLADSFKAYEVTKGVQPAAIGLKCEEPAKPYDYVLSKGGKPQAVVMLIPKGKERNYPLKRAREAAQSGRLKYVHFLMAYPNEESYIVSRLKSFL